MLEGALGKGATELFEEGRNFCMMHEAAEGRSSAMPFGMIWGPWLACGAIVSL